MSYARAIGAAGSAADALGGLKNLDLSGAAKAGDAAKAGGNLSDIALLQRGVLKGRSLDEAAEAAKAAKAAKMAPELGALELKAQKNLTDTTSAEGTKALVDAKDVATTRAIDEGIPEESVKTLSDRASDILKKGGEVSKSLFTSKNLQLLAMATIASLFIYNFILKEGNIKEALKQTTRDIGEIGGEVAKAAGETGGGLLSGIFEGMGIWLILLAVFALLLLIILL